MRTQKLLAALPVTLMLLGLAASLLLSVGCASAGARPGLPPPPPPAIGTWNLTIETPIGTQTPTFTVTGTAEALQGIFESPQGSLDAQSVMWADGQLSFAIDIDAGGQALHLEFSGTVDGDSMTGSFASDFGDMPVTGTRAP